MRWPQQPGTQLLGTGQRLRRPPQPTAKILAVDSPGQLPCFHGCRPGQEIFANAWFAVRGWCLPIADCSAGCSTYGHQTSFVAILSKVPYSKAGCCLKSTNVVIMPMNSEACFFLPGSIGPGSRPSHRNNRTTRSYRVQGGTDICSQYDPGTETVDRSTPGKKAFGVPPLSTVATNASDAKE